MEINSREVKVRMAQKGIESQAELARLIGVHKQSLTNWLKGRNTPTLGNVQALAEKLGCSIEEITFLVAPKITSLPPGTQVQPEVMH